MSLFGIIVRYVRVKESRKISRDSGDVVVTEIPSTHVALVVHENNNGTVNLAVFADNGTPFGVCDVAVTDTPTNHCCYLPKIAAPAPAPAPAPALDNSAEIAELEARLAKLKQ